MLKACPGCFCCWLFLRLRCPQVLGWSLNGSISLGQADSQIIHHKTGWWVWPWIALCDMWRGKWHQWKRQLFSILMEPICLLITPPLCILMIVVLATPGKLSKMVGNSASHQWYIDRLYKFHESILRYDSVGCLFWRLQILWMGSLRRPFSWIYIGVFSSVCNQCHNRTSANFRWNKFHGSPQNPQKL